MPIHKKNIINTVQLDFATFHLMDNGVLYFLPFTQTAGLNKEQIEETFQAVLLLTENKPVPLYVDMKTHIRLSSEEKSLVVSKLSTNITACAIKENNIVLRFVIHAFNHLYKLPVPIKMFKTEIEAIEWLKTF